MFKEPETFEAAMSLLTLAAKAVENYPTASDTDAERVTAALNRMLAAVSK